MALRVIDVTEHEVAPLRVVEPDMSRRDLRRIRRRWEIMGVTTLMLPFVTALVILGVVR
jgi:hypothetical protein